MSAPQNGKTIADQTEAITMNYSDFIPISQLQSAGVYASFKVTQQNLKKSRITSVTGTYVVLANDDIIKADATAGNFTITLPTAAGIAGVKKTIKKMNTANTITIACNGSETIDGVATKALTTQYTLISVVSDGTNWITV